MTESTAIEKERNIIKAGCRIALLCCLLVLCKFILFKKSPRYYRHYFAHEYRHYQVNDGWQHANLHTFSTIRLFSSPRVSTEYSYKNIGGNIIGFIPIGILLPLAFPFFRRWWRLLLSVFLLSLFFETVQLLTGIGVFDVDDLILNTGGGLVGYVLFAVTARMMRRHTTPSFTS